MEKILDYDLNEVLQAELAKAQKESQRLYYERFYIPSQDTAVYEDLCPAAARLADEWYNPVANTNTPTALNSNTRFYSYKLSYMELEYLAEEPFVQNIINTKAQDIVGNKGTFRLVGSAGDGEEVLRRLEGRLQELGFWEVVREATIMALTYGGALVYTKTSQDAMTPMPFEAEVYRGSPVLKLMTLSPRDATGIPGDTADVTHPYFMSPVSWYIRGQQFSNSQLVPLLYQEVTKNRKYYYNFLGVSIIQKVIPFVRKFETVYSLVVEYLSKVRTLCIASNRLYDDEKKFHQALEKVKAFLNNNGMIGIGTDEQVTMLSSPVSGFHEIANFSAQLIASITRIPATKLLGYSPLGLNNTGEYDLKTYYDVIEGYQKTYLHPFIISVAQRVLWGLGYPYTLEFEFTPLAQESNLEKTQRQQGYVSMLDSLIGSGIIDQELAFRLAKEQGILPENATFQAPEEPSDEEVQELQQLLRSPDGNRHNPPEGAGEGSNQLPDLHR